MKARAKNFLNINTLDEEYGIQVRSRGVWMYAAEDGKPLIYKTESERDAKMAAIRAMVSDNDHK